MKRFNYRVNQQALNVGAFYMLNPLGYVEIAPGDTISGKVDIDVVSDITVRPFRNRAYFDVYAFYVPYRLLFDQWVDFIKGDDSVTLPTGS